MANDIVVPNGGLEVVNPACPVDPIQINVSSGGTSAGGLAFTGTDIALIVAAGVALVGGGTLLTASTRRRRPALSRSGRH